MERTSNLPGSMPITYEMEKLDQRVAWNPAGWNVATQGFGGSVAASNACSAAKEVPAQKTVAELGIGRNNAVRNANFKRNKNYVQGANIAKRRARAAELRAALDVTAGQLGEKALRCEDPNCTRVYTSATRLVAHMDRGHHNLNSENMGRSTRGASAGVRPKARTGRLMQEFTNIIPEARLLAGRTDKAIAPRLITENQG
jgi:uncharacterized C2H2 Zn-finger protein